jgi:hypothetical protein
MKSNQRKLKENKVMRYIARPAFAMLLATLIWGQTASAQKASSSHTPRFKNLQEFAAWVQSNHKAPFDRDSARLPEGGAAAILNQLARRTTAAPAVSGHNVKINRDRDPWPKAEIAVGVDPTDGNIVVMSNDFRENWDHMFYHVSTTGGTTWSDDSMVGGDDPNTGFIPLTFESDPGVGFDDKGHSFLSTITGNSIFDFTNGYENFDTQIIMAEGFNHGTYSNLLPTVIDTQPCIYTPSTSNCPASLDKPLITVDSVPGSPNNGTIYVYYTVFCNSTPCTYGTGTIPAYGSAIVESHSPGAGLPFSSPQIVSGSLSNEQFSYIVVDSHGVPHAFFDDYGASINMYMSTLTAGGWVVNPTPVATFNPRGTASPNWGFRISGTIAPGCGIHVDTAYCAFSSNQVGTGPTESGMSVYLASIHTKTGKSTISRVNNDVFNDSKDHIFPWATTKTDGSVYVGFYDDRDDPFLTKVKYWVAKSTDGGKTFPTQMAVSDTSFNPCVGFPGCGFFGDYTQIATGPDGVVHASWSDTRDGASMQIFGQAISW